MVIIGVTGGRVPASVTHPDYQAVLEGHTLDTFFSAYGRCLAAAGASAVYVSREADPRAVIGRVDGIMLAGGLDVDPAVYGGVRTERSTVVDRAQDEFDLALTRAALDRGVPVLGTCRGHEVLNVALGGTLTDVDEHAHNVRSRSASEPAHKITTVEGSVLARLYGPVVEVNSLHHQAVDQRGRGVRATATAADGVVEGIEVEGHAAIGVQWHPEMMDSLEPIIEWVVQESAASGQAAAEKTKH